MATLNYFGWEIPDPFSPTYEDLWGYTLNSLFEDMVEFYHHQYEFAYSLGNISGAVAVDLTNGTYQYGTATGNISSVTVSNWPASGKAGFVTLEINQDGTGSRTIALSSAYKTRGGAAIELSTAASAKDLLYLRTRDAGTTILTDISKGYA